MATYVFFEGYGVWYLANAEQEMDGQFFDVPVKKGYECGYFMLNEMQEMCYKHAGKPPHYLYPCFDADIKQCAFRKSMNDPGFKDYLNQKGDVLIYPYFRIDDDKKYSLVVVELKDIQTVDQPPAQTSSQESEVSTMQALAIMAWMLSEKNSHYKIAGRPNAKNINDAIQPLVEEAFPNDPPKLKSFNKKISEALKLFNPE